MWALVGVSFEDVRGLAAAQPIRRMGTESDAPRRRYGEARNLPRDAEPGGRERRNYVSEENSDLPGSAGLPWPSEGLADIKNGHGWVARPSWTRRATPFFADTLKMFHN